MTVRVETAKTPRRDGHEEPRGTEAHLKQYIEVVRGEPARWPREARGQAGRSGVSAVAVETFMNNVGLDNEADDARRYAVVR